MKKYLFRRLLQALVTLWLLTVVIFILVHLTGDPRDVLLDVYATAEDRAALTQRLGLDKPLPVQYFIYLQDMVTGDFGTSFRTNRPAFDTVAERVPRTLILGGVALLFAVLIAVPIGVMSAVRKDSVIDFIGKVVALLGQSMPPFWLGLMLMLLFGVRLGWFPVSGIGLSHIVLPAVTIGWFVVAGLMRMVRSAMLDSLDEDYVKLARIKGVSERKVIWKHALRNAVIPPLTYGGILFASVLGGSIVAETVFAWPGVGQLVVDAITFRDFPVVQTVMMLFGVLYVSSSIIVDVLYAYIDPRIRY